MLACRFLEYAFMQRLVRIIIRLKYLFRFERFNIGVHNRVKKKNAVAWKLKTFHYVCAHRETNGKVHATYTCVTVYTYMYVTSDWVFNSRALSQGVIVLGPFPINPPICLAPRPCSISHPPVCSISDLLRPSSAVLHFVIITFAFKQTKMAPSRTTRHDDNSRW